MRTPISCLILSLLSLAPLARAQEWTSIGGPPGGRVFHVGISGAHALATTPNGVFRSTNGGASWTGPVLELENPGASFRALDVFGGLAVLRTSDGEVYRSTDGVNWSLISLPVDPLPYYTLDLAHGNGRLYLRKDGAEFNAETLHYSDDNGDTWHLLALPRAAAITVFGDEVFVLSMLVTDGGWTRVGTLHHSTNRGADFSIIGGGDEDLNGLPGDAAGPAMRVGGKLVSGMHYSTDGGQSWTPFDVIEHTGYLWSWSMKAIDGVLYVYGFRADPGTDPEPWHDYYIYTTTDLQTYTQHAMAPLPRYQFQIGGLAGSGGVLLYGSQQGLFRSVDTAASWSPAPGLETASVRALASVPDTLLVNIDGSNQVWRKPDGAPWEHGSIFPADEWRDDVFRLWSPGGAAVYAAHTYAGISRSLDGGRNWTQVNGGVPQFNGAAGGQFYPIMNMLFHNGHYFAVTGPGEEFICTGREASFMSTGGGVLRSANGSAWTRLASGLPVIGISCFLEPLIEPTLSIAAVGDTLLVGAAQRGIFRSTNNGSSWTASNTGFPVGEPVLDLLTIGGTVYAAVSFGVYASEDQGHTWNNVASGLPGGDYRLHEFNGDVYVAISTWFPTSPGDIPALGVYRMRPELFDFERVGSRLNGVGVYALATHEGVLYAGTEGLGAWALTTTIPVLRGDADCDGQLTNFDIDPFVLALVDHAAWTSQYCDGSPATLDTNCDGVFTNFDIDPFVACLVSGCPACN